uniref:Uncharacterized protein n=1 Tax=Siphoviridae sp. ctMBu2 TaxID=2827853 RepID=A0A8S5T519_9CAUD|nr:MAG TPA: hypothetical protein [Siphoviridae sp. ctMBu2]
MSPFPSLLKVAVFPLLKVAVFPLLRKNTP